MDHLLPAQHQPPPHHHPPGPAPLSSGLPMSPRNPPLSLQQVPGTPTPSPSRAIPPMHHPPHPSDPPPAPFTTFPSSTPSTANLSTPFSANASAFIPAKKVSIKNASGQEVTLDTLKWTPPTTILPHPPSPASVNKDIRRQPIRIESQEQKEKRLAEERANEGKSDDKSKSSEALVRPNDVTSRCEVEEQECPKEQERGSGRNRNPNSLYIPPNKRSASIGLGSISSSMDKCAGSGFLMGQFSTSASKMVSEERFPAPNTDRPVSTTGGSLRGRPRTMVRAIRQCGTRSEHTRSKCSAADSSRTSVTGNAGPTMPVFIMGPPMEPIAPLERSANRWVAISTRRIRRGVNTDSPVMVGRKVKGLLNKLTMKRFDSISDQIIAWANKFELEKGGRVLFHVIKLIFNKAVDEAIFSEMYARLCRKMMGQISPKVQDDVTKNAEGRPLVGGQLCRCYLLYWCQKGFEAEWLAEDITATTAATKATGDQAVKEANEKTKRGEEPELYSDDYYAAAKAKHRGLGLIRFIGELFKLRILTERIMHECIKKLLRNVENPEVEEIESLCLLLTTAGSLLDTEKARAHLDVYFSRMQKLTKNKNVNVRMVSKLQDVVELRERRWVPRHTVTSPMTIAQVHEAFSKELRAPEEGRVTGGAGSLQAALPTLSEAETKAKIEADTKEFFSTRMLDKAESYFSSLRTEHRHLLVEALVTKSIEMKGQDVVLVSELFVRVRENGLCSPAAFEEGFEGLTELLNDLSVDVPKASAYFATLLTSSGLDQDEGRRRRTTKKTMDADKLNSLLWRAFACILFSVCSILLAHCMTR